MKATVAILTRWRHEDPDRLLQSALRQARELAELLPELAELRSQNATLRQQLEIQAKRIAQLEEALLGAERAAHRQAAPFRIEEKKRVLAPKPPGRKHGHPGAFRHPPDQSISLLKPNCVLVLSAGLQTLLISRGSNSLSKTFPRCVLR